MTRGRRSVSSLLLTLDSLPSWGRESAPSLLCYSRQMRIVLTLIRGTAECGPHCCNRLCEWGMATAMTLMGVGLFIWPNALVFGNLHKMLSLLSEFSIAVLLLYIGILRIGCLIANGSLPWIGPIIRSGCATVGAIILSQMSYALAKNGIVPMPPGVFFFGGFCVVELISAFRAASDARERRRRNP